MPASGAVWACVACAAAFAGTYLALLSPAGWRGLASRRSAALRRATDGLRRAAVRLGREDASAAAGEELPELLDVLALGLGAGLSFDMSLRLYCDHFDNGTSRSLEAAMLGWRLGTGTREEALSRLAEEWGTPAARRFATSVAEALRFGSPLAATLERQAASVRDEARSRVEEEIERAPVKMLVPLGTLIVPAMLLAVLGPLVAAASLTF